jgi:hypothetical protein
VDVTLEFRRSFRARISPSFIAGSHGITFLVAGNRQKRSENRQSEQVFCRKSHVLCFY